MEWLLLAVLAIIWAAVLLLPSGGRRTSPTNEIAKFHKKMNLLADTEGKGRWVVQPNKDLAFMSENQRERARVLERRRQVFAFLAEAFGLTFIIGLLPPLRFVWIIASGVAVVLVGYVWLLVRLKTIEDGGHGVAQQQAADHRVGTVARGHDAGQRFIADRTGRTARSSYAGLATFGEDDVHVVVHRAE